MRELERLSGVAVAENESTWAFLPHAVGEAIDNGRVEPGLIEGPSDPQGASFIRNIGYLRPVVASDLKSRNEHANRLIPP